MSSLILITEDYPRQAFQLGRAMLMIGRDDSSEIHVPDDSVSRNHASIVFDGQNFVVRDNGSTNGTYVNGERVSRHNLRHHDLIRFGSCLFLVDMREDRKGPKGTDFITVIHSASKENKVVELSPKPLIPGSAVKPVKVILSSKELGRKQNPPPPLTAR